MSKWMRFILDSGRVGTKRLLRPRRSRSWSTPQIRAANGAVSARSSLSRPHAFSYGLGWFIQDYRGATVWMHTGSIDGMSAIIGLLPDQRMGVYVLANIDHAELRHALMYQAFDLYSRQSAARLERRACARCSLVRNRPLRRRRVGDLPRPGRRCRSSGTQAPTSTPTYGSFEIASTGGSLRARFRNVDLGELEPVQGETFRSKPETRRRRPDGA